MRKKTGGDLGQAASRVVFSSAHWNLELPKNWDWAPRVILTGLGCGPKLWDFSGPSGEGAAGVVTLCRLRVALDPSPHRSLAL